jgi:uncharacterized protein YbbC (DUF1343 family)
MKKLYLLVLAIALLSLFSCKQANETDSKSDAIGIIPGADQTELYLSLLEGKNVAMTLNQTSRIGDKLSLDSLVTLGINVVKVFGPEHGFRGGNVYDSIDTETGVPIISLYRGKRKPSVEDLANVDVMIYDIQDVGVRFYTYLATLHYVMEACAENDVELIVFDRPNPNDYYVDGPVLEEGFESFVGLNPIPILHGLTLGEYATMLNGEGWLANGVQCKIHVIKVKNYEHGMPYELPIDPSPNLNTNQSVLLYPSLCWFEGTIISQGRGTDPLIAFTVLGSPELEGKYTFSFDVVVDPRYVFSDYDTVPVTHYGLDLRDYDTDIFKETGQLNLQWLIEMYKAYPDKDKFFRKSTDGEYGRFKRLTGTDKLWKQIVEGKTEEEIRESWEPALSEYKKIRKKYLLY